MTRTPAGRTSSIKALNKTFILQTEFVTKPRTRIVTSVALEGQIIHKVERTFDSHLESDEDFRIAETAVVAQHQNLAKKIQTNGADFIKQTRSIRISAMDRLALIPGVSFVADIEEKLVAEKPHEIYTQSKLVAEIADALSLTTKMGDFKTAAILSEHGKFVLERAEGKNFLMTLKPDAEVGTILNEAMKE
jgi:hypothetical protein